MSKEVATKTVIARESSNDHVAGLKLIINTVIDSYHIANVNVARETPANAAAHGSDVDVAATCYLSVNNFIVGKHALGAAAAQEIPGEVTKEAAAIPDCVVDVAAQQRKDDIASAAQMDAIVGGVASQDFDDTTEVAQLDASINAAATRERVEVIAAAIDSPSVVNTTVNKDENQHHAAIAMGKNSAIIHCRDGLYATAVRTTIPAKKTVEISDTAASIYKEKNCNRCC
ncbi:hypothetical protein ACH5RR_018262 [Cinchona calisaya]|uniref:Uncharacterized protein n=1 Tax=Cinchona calisaya TaxID=153742 RepID=A0ABD2ZR21_9GENT